MDEEMREGGREKESLDFLIVYVHVCVLACIHYYHIPGMGMAGSSELPHGG